MTESACSDLGHEPLPGTAKSGTLFIALEHQYGWSRDILDGGVFGDELTARIKAWLAERGGALQLIRKPGRLGQIPCDGVTMYVAHCPPGTGDAAPRLEVRKVCDVEEMLSLDIRLGRPTEGARVVDKPLLLVCTHGKRDRCCAVKGRPIAQALNNVHPDVVWETSHSKGHRFAPALVLLPWNYSYGRLSAAATNEMLVDASSGVLHPAGCRGRGVWDPRGQVAELAAREAIGEWGIDAVASVEVSDAEAGGESDAKAVVGFGDGRKVAVELAKTVTDGVVSSCGDAPGPKKGWRALAAEEL
ncbi:sucrase ferredoxin [Corynebacterium sp. NPDC060344]|uniref:sucrase ferredoxin n=1 Tax=Corynebacterium sp. NPDC060344 TaxID=3347101 RepID=UPI003665853A